MKYLLKMKGLRKFSFFMMILTMICARQSFAANNLPEANYYIVIADRTVVGTLGIFDHMSLELISSPKKMVVGDSGKFSRIDFTREKGVELLADGGWSVWKKEKQTNYLPPAVAYYTYKWAIETNVSVSMIVNRSNGDDDYGIVFSGTRRECNEKFNELINLAKNYEWAEKQENLKYEQFYNWYKSIYVITINSTNSNTFVKELCKRANLRFINLPGNQAGADAPGYYQNSSIRYVSNLEPWKRNENQPPYPTESPNF